MSYVIVAIVVTMLCGACRGGGAVGLPPPLPPPVPPCPGDCNGDGQVTVDELITISAIARGDVSVERCPAADVNADGEVTVDELIQVVNVVLAGACPQ